MINLVNGYVCHNCTDVDYAKKGIDPSHPNKNDPLNPKMKAQNAIAGADPVVILSGALAKLAAANSPDAVPSSTAANQNPSLASDASTTGTQLNISV